MIVWENLTSPPLSASMASQQSRVWDLGKGLPQSIALIKEAVNDVSGDWPVLYTVQGGGFVEISEILLYNGDSGSTTFLIAILDETDAIPSGSAIDQPGIFLARTLATGVSDLISCKIPLRQGWRVAIYTSAGAGVNANVLISGLAVDYLA